MSNRQARREQSRTSRPAKTPAGRPSGGRTPQRPSSGGGGTNLFSRPYLIGVSILIVAAAIILGYVVSQSGGTDKDGLAAKLEQSKTDLASVPAAMFNGTKIGSDDAPIKLTEYEDFQCPFCLHYTAQQEPTLINEYVKTGKMQIDFQNLPLLGNGESVQAAVAGACAADQNMFWQMHNKLFTVQAEAGQGDTGGEKIDVGRFSNDKLKQYAGEAGLDQAKFNSCFDNSSDKITQITDQQRTAKGFGINGTPGFLINGTPIGTGTPADLDGWRTALDKILTTTPTPTGSATSTGTQAAGSPTAAVTPKGTSTP
jgi:protein-disulfide isomerase